MAQIQTGRKGSVAIETLGCKLNQAESDVLARGFAQAGFSVVGTDAPADIFILNSCTVTHVADRKARQSLRQARRLNPEAFVVATGCYAQRAPQELSAMPEVNMVVGNRDKMMLLELMGLARREKLVDAVHLPARTRAFIEIQQGCNQVCAYCIVPKVRGREKSKNMDVLVEEAKRLVLEGYKEIVLTGTQLGSYYSDVDNWPFSDTPLETLFSRIARESGVHRLRTSSLQPQDITRGIIEMFANGMLCPHLHVPLQSGCDATLKRMRRRYNTRAFRESVDRLRSAVPDIAITTDLIVGFPGESDEEFAESYGFCKEAGFATIHVFPYSVRQGTTAAFLPEQVTPEVKRARMELMLSLAKESAFSFRARFVGTKRKVLWEDRDDGGWSGLTDNYIKVKAQSYEPITNQIIKTLLLADNGDSMTGTLSG